VAGLSAASLSARCRESWHDKLSVMMITGMIIMMDGVTVVLVRIILLTGRATLSYRCLQRLVLSDQERRRQFQVVVLPQQYGSRKQEA
jgi:hypothetical protein